MDTAKAARKDAEDRPVCALDPHARRALLEFGLNESDLAYMGDAQRDMVLKIVATDAAAHRRP